MYFLVKGTVQEQWYGNDTAKETEELRLVIAESEGEAVRKFEKHFKDKTDEYAVYYYVHNAEALETIE